MARIGSSEPVELRQEMSELIEGFDISRFGAAPTKFDVEDLPPLSAKLLHGMELALVKDDLATLEVPETVASDFWEMARENITSRKDILQRFLHCCSLAFQLLDLLICLF